jgi:hypothetical protein
MLVASLVVALLAQTPATAEERAAAAAEAAAAAAKSAAEAAQKAADALAKLAELEAKEHGAAPAAPAAAPAPAAPPSLWSGGASVGLTWLTGNSESLTFGALGNLQRKSERTIIGVKTWATYGENTTTFGTPTKTVIAANFGLSGQLDIRLIEKVSIILGSGFDSDYVKNVEARGFWEAGVGVLWVDVKEEDYQKVFLKTDLTFRIGYESRYNYFPNAKTACYQPDRKNGGFKAVPTGADVDVDGNPLALPSCADGTVGGGNALLVAPRLALAFKYSLTKTIVFTEDFEVMPSVVKAQPTDPFRALINNTAKISLRIFGNFGFGIASQLRVDTFPAADKKSVDHALLATIDTTF